MTRRFDFVLLFGLVLTPLNSAGPASKFTTTDQVMRKIRNVGRDALSHVRRRI